MTALIHPPGMEQAGSPGARFLRGDLFIAAGMLGYLFIAWLLCRLAGEPQDFAPFLYVGPLYLSYVLYALTILAILQMRQSRGRLGQPLFGIAVTLTPRAFLIRLISALPILVAGCISEWHPGTGSASDIGRPRARWSSSMRSGAWRSPRCRSSYACAMRPISNRARLLISYPLVMVLLGNVVAGLFSAGSRKSVD